MRLAAGIPSLAGCPSTSAAGSGMRQMPKSATKIRSIVIPKRHYSTSATFRSNPFNINGLQVRFKIRRYHLDFFHFSLHRLHLYFSSTEGVARWVFVARKLRGIDPASCWGYGPEGPAPQAPGRCALLEECNGQTDHHRRRRNERSRRSVGRRPSARKDHWISFRVTAEEHFQLLDKAQRSGMSAGEYARSRTMRGIARAKKTAPTTAPNCSATRRAPCSTNCASRASTSTRSRITATATRSRRRRGRRTRRRRHGAVAEAARDHDRAHPGIRRLVPRRRQILSARQSCRTPIARRSA